MVKLKNTDTHKFMIKLKNTYTQKVYDKIKKYGDCYSINL